MGFQDARKKRGSIGVDPRQGVKCLNTISDTGVKRQGHRLRLERREEQTSGDIWEGFQSPSYQRGSTIIDACGTEARDGANSNLRERGEKKDFREQDKT